MKSQNLSIKELKLINSKVAEKEKSVWKTYLLTALLGWTGVQWFYLKRKKQGVPRLIVFVLISTVIGLSAKGQIPTKNILGVLVVASLSILILWNIIDLLLINRVNDKINEQNEKEATEEVVNKRTQGE